MIDKYFLPGTNQQINYFLKNQNVAGQKILIVGASSQTIAEDFMLAGAGTVSIIVEDHQSLLNSRLLLAGNKNISVRLMEFEHTDFSTQQFDIIYAQASITNDRRNKIVKEIKRILKDGGVFCIGEPVSLSQKIPAFVEDVLNNSAVRQLYIEEVPSYYSERGFRVINSYDLSATLKDFYIFAGKELNKQINELSNEEKSYYKKLLKRIGHEANIYLKLGGKTHMGFLMLVLEKELN